MIFKVALANSQRKILFDKLTFEWLTSEPTLCRIDFINNLELLSNNEIVFANGRKNIQLCKLIERTFFYNDFDSLEGIRLRHLNKDPFDFRLKNLELIPSLEFNQN